MRTGGGGIGEPDTGGGKAPADAGSAGTLPGGKLRMADIQEKKVSSEPPPPAPTAASPIGSRVRFGVLQSFLQVPRFSSLPHAVSRPLEAGTGGRMIRITTSHVIVGDDTAG